MRKIDSKRRTAGTTVTGGGRRRRPEEVKGRILAAARHAFAQNGFEGATTRAIAKDAGVKLPLLLYHFKSKELLWRAVMVDILEPYVERLLTLKAEMKGEPAADILKAVIAEMVHHFAQRPELHRLMTGEGHRKSARLAWLCDAYVERLFGMLRGLIISAQREGKLRPRSPDFLRYAIISMAAVPFSMRYEYERLTGRKILSAAGQRATVKFINDMVFAP